MSNSFGGEFVKVAILAGGRGSRLAEETKTKPKPMVEIGGRPILWHIIEHYRHFGFDEFVVALGYKGQQIRDYFNRLDDRSARIEFVETGAETETGGRVKRLQHVLADERFLLAWGDGLTDLNPCRLVDFHHEDDCQVSIVAVHPPSRFGSLELDGDLVTSFVEKPVREDVWINAGIFVVEPGVVETISGDGESWEYDSLVRLSRAGQLRAYRHTGFWQCMDTLNEKMLLEKLWQQGNAPWKSWS